MVNYLGYFVVKTTSISAYKDTKNNRENQIIQKKNRAKFGCFK